MDWGHGPAWLRGFAHGAEFGRPSSAPLLRTSRAYPLWSYYVALVYSRLRAPRLGSVHLAGPDGGAAARRPPPRLRRAPSPRAVGDSASSGSRSTATSTTNRPEEESIWPSPRGAERPVTLEQALSRNRDMMQTRYTLMEPNEPEESETGRGL